MPIAPSLLLTARSTLEAEYAYWTSDDNTGNPFIGLPYQWQLSIDVDLQSHSNATTPTPDAYSGTDVQVGDWFASQLSGQCLKIVTINNASLNNIDVIVEDYERYNLMSDPNQSGTGLPPDGPGMIFRVSDEGLPILGPMAELYLTATTVSNIMARFIARNGTSSFVLVKQHNHGFFVGDVICANPDVIGAYRKTGTADLQHAIGIVSESNVPGLDYFSYRPLGRLINNVNPPLFGQHGSIFYLDPDEPGAVTMDMPASNPVPIYMQLDLPTRAIILERGVEQVSSSSSTAKYDITNVSAGQTQFTMPSTAKSVLYMAINGVENEDFTFNVTTKALVFDPVKTGYGVDVDDEVFFIYTT